MEFQKFPKIPRLYGGGTVTITEKIDGTNAQVLIIPAHDDPEPETALATPLVEGVGVSTVRAGSRKRWLTVEQDNFGFAAYVKSHANQLVFDLGPGRHFGEFYGRGIQRGYGLDNRRFALFNVSKWRGVEFETPALEVVPVVGYISNARTFDAARADGDIWGGIDVDIEYALYVLRDGGSQAVPGYMNPEGVVVYHHRANQLFKVLLHGDRVSKWES